VYRERREKLERLTDEHCAGERAVAWDAGHLACGKCPSCQEQLIATDDVLLVSGVRVTQRRKLREAGVYTVADLAAAPQSIPGIAQQTIDALRAQARLERGEAGVDFGSVRIEMHTPAALGQIPEPDAGDVFFDFEGDPLFQDADRSWNLEYLFGFITHEDGREVFDSFWADDREAEGRALDAFVQFIEARRAAFPSMHVYHYANYEKNALLKLAARHGRHEKVIDDWLNAGLFFDLYPIVRNSMRSSAGSLGLKALEPLYMGDELRGEEVATGADSVVAYAEYATLKAGGEHERAARLRREILDYNEYDCVSTSRLRDWLLAQAEAAGVARQAVQPSALEDADLQDASDDQQLVDALNYLAARAADPAEGADPQAGRAWALLGSAVDYHRRENKPHWWAHFDRLSSPPDEWMPSSEVVLADAVTCDSPWERPTPRSFRRRKLTLTGVLPEGSSLRAGLQVGLLYEEPPACVELGSTGHRGWSGRAEIIDIRTVGDHFEIEVGERINNNGCEHSELPMAIIPGRQVPTKSLEEAIRKFGEQLVARDEITLPAHPVLDLLQRKPPRLRDGAQLPGVDDGADGYIDAIGRAVYQLEDSYLAVQGPPGTGKTFIGARVIGQLVAAGWKIGVTAQSHEVVENLLREIIAAGCPADFVGKKASSVKANPQDAPPWRVLDTTAVAQFFSEFEGQGAVLGGTAWDMVKLNEDELDLLVIDEAGQFTLANTIAVTRVARRLLLLGDPQQLPQVTQGTHGEPVDESALGWLLADHETLPPEFGYFLAETW
ncbi:MAG TPA: TM0106 family RecB-like putative nuclease, partial [Actinomycetales bacterium]|nr:TM0106 family RecB-like putative nuclease [Actinomycetales bacterium]